jgi:DNA-binding NarL/FixJ family response regulator
MSNHTIRVVLADDHPIVLDGLKAILAATPAIEVVGVVRSFEALIALPELAISDVLILDIGGMGGSPLMVVAHILRDHPAVRIVIFSSSIDLAPELLQAGVRGYVPKEHISDQLLRAIHAVYASQTYLAPEVVEYLELAQQAHKQYRLAPKELSVLKLLAMGLGTAEIAQQLQIDQRSVQNYITALRRKIGCHERTQLVDWYRRISGITPAATSLPQTWTHDSM